MSSLSQSPLRKFLLNTPEKQKADRALALDVLHRLQRILDGYSKDERPVVVFSVYPTVATVSSTITVALMHPACTDPLHPRQWTQEQDLTDRRLKRLVNTFNNRPQGAREFIMDLWWNEGVPASGGFTRESMTQQEQWALGREGRALQEAAQMTRALQGLATQPTKAPARRL